MQVSQGNKRNAHGWKKWQGGNNFARSGTRDAPEGPK